MTDLGEYKGLPIAGHALALKNAGEGLSKAMRVSPTDLEPGEEIHLLVRAKAGNVLMRVDDIDAPSNWTVEQSLTAQTITIVSREFADDKIAAQLVAEAKMKEAENRKKGIHPIAPGMGLDKGPLLTVDGSGVQIIGEADIAAARERGETLTETTPVIAQLDDDVDNRMMWPHGYRDSDDFAPDDPRPQLGDQLERGVVTQLVDPDSGDVLDPEPEPEPEPTEAQVVEMIATAEAEIGPDPDSAIVEWLADTAANVKAAIASNLSTQWLNLAYEAELAGENRTPVKNAIKVRIDQLDGV